MARVIDVAVEQEKFAGMWREADIKQFGARADQTSLVRVSFRRGPATVTVEPKTYGGDYIPEGGRNELSWTPEEANDAAMALAHAIAHRVAEYDYDCARTRAAIEDKRQAATKADKAERQLALVLGAKRPQPHMRDMLLRSYRGGPEVWLHGWSDKDRGSSAFGYCWPSVEEFWRDHPEYRPVEWGDDEHGPWMRLQVATMPRTT